VSTVDLAAESITIHDGMADRVEFDAYIPPTVPYEEVKARLLADPATRAAYDALEPAYQIACLRIEAGLTQAQLAELVGTKQPSIARLERGQSQPTIEFLRRLGAALGKRLEIRFVPIEQAENG
jgi:DNA-binding XRE family transcriptional regulator